MDNGLSTEAIAREEYWQLSLVARSVSEGVRKLWLTQRYLTILAWFPSATRYPVILSGFICDGRCFLCAALTLA